MTFRILTLLCRLCGIVLLLGRPSLYGSDQIPGAPSPHPIVIRGATLHPVTSDVIENGTLIIVDGKISALGKDLPLPESAVVIDAAGADVYPGFIDAYARIGTVELPSVRASVDDAETGLYNPNVKVKSAINPDSELIPVSRRTGVLLALAAPRGGTISGHASVIQLDGWTNDDMALVPEAALVISLPSPGSSAERTLREFLDQARRYDKAVSSGSNPRHDLKLAAMRPVLHREIPVVIRANRWNEINHAVAFAVEQNLRLIIRGGEDAPICADLLRQHDIPVMVEGTHRLPTRSDAPYDTGYALPAKLNALGIRFCLTGGEAAGHGNVRNLPFQAGTAVAYGLSPEEAIRAITFAPAQILNIDQRVGSLEPGKDATLFLCEGDPLEVVSSVKAAWIQGRPVELDDRQEQLHRKYQQKYQQRARLPQK